MDYTAEMAISNVGRQERKEKSMAKKRNCRRTTDENIIHDKAVKMRKMTDEQLVHYVEDRVAKAHSEGFNQGKKASGTKIDVQAIVYEIGNIRGVGAAKMKQISNILVMRLGEYDG